MTDITTGNEFVPPRHRPPRLVEEQIRPTDAEISEVVGRPVQSVLDDTDLQRIAVLVAALTYGDMKLLAAGILSEGDGSAETLKSADGIAVVDLADKLHGWATKTRAPQ